MIRWIQAIAVMVLQGLPAFMARQGFRSGRLTLSAALLLLVGDGLCQDPSPAQSPSLQPDPIVVTVSAEAIPLSASSASVTILTREFVEESRAESMADLLRQVPFLYMSQTGGRGGLTTVSLRGGETNFTLVMIDGVPVNDITNLLGGAVDFATISTDNIEQVEIVRGPMSSLYGSEGIGGVINIITRSGEDEPYLSVEGTLGNFGTSRAGFQSGGKLSWVDYSLSGSYFDIDEQIENDGFSVGTVSFKSTLPLGAGKALQFTTRYQDSRSRGFPENGGGPGFSILRDPKVADVEQLTLGLGYQQQVSPGWLYGLDFDLFSRQQDDMAPAILDGLPPSPPCNPPFEQPNRFPPAAGGLHQSTEPDAGTVAELRSPRQKRRRVQRHSDCRRFPQCLRPGAPHPGRQWRNPLSGRPAHSELRRPGGQSRRLRNRVLSQSWSGVFPGRAEPLEDQLGRGIQVALLLRSRRTQYRQSPTPAGEEPRV